MAATLSIKCAWALKNIPGESEFQETCVPPLIVIEAMNQPQGLELGFLGVRIKRDRVLRIKGRNQCAVCRFGGIKSRFV